MVCVTLLWSTSVDQLQFLLFPNLAQQIAIAPRYTKMKAKINAFYVYSNQWFTFTLMVLRIFDESLWKLSLICQKIAVNTGRFDMSVVRTANH